jgi:hypothetical protein
MLKNFKSKTQVPNQKLKIILINLHISIEATQVLWWSNYTYKTKSALKQKRKSLFGVSIGKFLFHNQLKPKHLPYV